MSKNKGANCFLVRTFSEADNPCRTVIKRYQNTWPDGYTIKLLKASYKNRKLLAKSIECTWPIYKTSTFYTETTCMSCNYESFTTTAEMSTKHRQQQSSNSCVLPPRESIVISTLFCVAELEAYLINNDTTFSLVGPINVLYLNNEWHDRWEGKKQQYWVGSTSTAMSLDDILRTILERKACLLTWVRTYCSSIIRWYSLM